MSPVSSETLSVAVFVGPLFGDGKRRFIGIYDVTGTPEKPRIIEFTTRMGELHAIHILPWIYPEHVTWRDKEEARPGVAIAWAETHGPLDQDYPAPSQLLVFGNSDSMSMKEGESVYIRHRRGVRSHYVHSDEPREDIDRIVRKLARRAFRRPISKELEDQFVNLALARRQSGNTFEQSVQAGVAAILCSPHFLLLNRETDVDDYTIASRLSYFLWSSMPDAELYALAEQGELRDPKVRRQQVKRMLADPKIERFIEHFTGQWLDLRELEFTTPDKKLYPEYDELLLRSMLAETRAFFRHILSNDLSILNFVDSEFVMINQRLAMHYGIEGVRGHEHVRRVSLPDDSIRGGILTHASVMKVTANGTSTSPVMRGTWVLENLLGRPVPPPPAGVPAVEPDIRGATTIRNQLHKHRADASCAGCHARIDPLGFALEEFDVIGGERQRYRSLGKDGERVPKVNYRVGPTVAKGGTLSNGRAFADFAEFRQILLENPDSFAKAFAKKLLVYGCGRQVTDSDRQTIAKIVGEARKERLGMQSLIMAVINSDLFLAP